jgi:hypothetical protein
MPSSSEVLLDHIADSPITGLEPSNRHTSTIIDSVNKTSSTKLFIISLSFDIDLNHKNWTIIDEVMMI